jgi:hypothetical protein
VKRSKIKSDIERDERDVEDMRKDSTIIPISSRVKNGHRVRVGGVPGQDNAAMGLPRPIGGIFGDNQQP